MQGPSYSIRLLFFEVDLALRTVGHSFGEGIRVQFWVTSHQVEFRLGLEFSVKHEVKGWAGLCSMQLGVVMKSRDNI